MLLLLESLIPIYKEANHILQLLNNQRILSKRKWNELTALKHRLELLLLRIEPAQLPLSIVSQVGNQRINIIQLNCMMSRK